VGLRGKYICLHDLSMKVKYSFWKTVQLIGNVRWLLFSLITLLIFIKSLGRYSSLTDSGHGVILCVYIYINSLHDLSPQTNYTN
jgi:hypothetical protein